MSPMLRSPREKASYSTLWLLMPVCVIASLLLIALSIGLLNASSSDAVLESPVERRPGTHDPAIAAEVAHDIRRFALNAFLVPVLDEEATPARWQDPSLAIPCQPGTQVDINGRPIEPGLELSGQGFSVLWTMTACLPFGAGGPELSGAAEVVAFRDDEGLSAIVHLRNLHVRHRGQQLVMDTTLVPGAP